MPGLLGLEPVTFQVNVLSVRLWVQGRAGCVRRRTMHFREPSPGGALMKALLACLMKSAATEAEADDQRGDTERAHP